MQRIALGAADDRVFVLGPGVQVLDLDGARQVHFVGAALAFDDDLRVADHRLELHDAAFDERLLLFGILVFRVFGDIAEFFGLADAIVHLFAVDGLELVKLGLELAQSVGGQYGLFFLHRVLSETNALTSAPLHPVVEMFRSAARTATRAAAADSPLRAHPPSACPAAPAAPPPSRWCRTSGRPDSGCSSPAARRHVRAARRHWPP